MPELCEVQIMTENLDLWSQGKELQKIEILDVKLEQACSSASEIQGQKVQRAWRRAKYTILDLETHSLVLHYRMTGKLVLEDEARKWIRLRIVFVDGTRIVFSDPRRFGEARLLPKDSVSQYFQDKNLGDEPWSEGGEPKTGAWWQERLGSLRNPIKPAMLRQDKVVGLGNILGSEICFRARINPRQRASTLNLNQWNRIAESAQSCIEEVLAEERSEEIGYVNQGNELPVSFRVYGRKKTPCPVCQTPIESFVQQSRSTYWCPSCQDNNQ
jgi:formamidopyrimidine-DNA glycosylase